MLPSATPVLDVEVVAAALEGLRATPKTLPPKLFYDDEGCRLFAAITRLPEYYPTRTELALLRRVAPEIAATIAPGAALIEYGGSDETKAAILFDATPAFSAYTPIDVAAGALAALERRLRRSHPRLLVRPLVADFLAPLTLPAELAGHPRFGFFPGSTIGNLDPAQAHAFLVAARHTLGPGARFLVGADLRKDESLLLAAYDDRQGVTAAFNRNLLHRLNREAAATFDPAAFAHQARWNPAESRIEMHLVSLRPQTVRVAGETIAFTENETIHTENSYKFDRDGFAGTAAAAGWNRLHCWTDSANLFSLHLFQAAE